MRHSPFPWYRQGHDIVAADGTTVAEVLAQSSPAVTNGNAAILSAAPQLLRAITKLRTDWTSNLSQAIRLVDSAITDATEPPRQAILKASKHTAWFETDPPHGGRWAVPSGTLVDVVEVEPGARIPAIIYRGKVKQPAKVRKTRYHIRARDAVKDWFAWVERGALKFIDRKPKRKAAR